jgi:guanylate kinase
MPGQLYVISGPSGVGKSTIIRRLREKIADLDYSISHTSRRPRRNETEGVDYYFVNAEVFREMIDEGAFVEWAEVYQDLYGTSSSGLVAQLEAGRDVVLDLDHQGAQRIKEQFNEGILIYLLPPSVESLETRLRGRATDDEEVIKRRIEKAFADLRNCVGYDYLIINDDPNQAVCEVAAIVTSERRRRTRMLPKVQKMLGL